jgi:hypothetical protein
MPVLAQQTDLDAAFRGASLRAGMWVASLSQTEQAMFPRGVRALYLNIWMTVDGEKPPARTELVKGLLGLDRISPVPGIEWLTRTETSILAEDRVEFQSRVDPAHADTITVRAIFARDGSEGQAMVAFKGKAVPIVFLRPQAGNMPFEGDWIADDAHVSEEAVLHVRARGRDEFMANLDIVRSTASLGELFTGAIKDDRLRLMITRFDNAYQSIDLAFDSTGTRLEGVLGHGSLRASDFRRLAAGWYTLPGAPWSK